MTIWLSFIAFVSVFLFLDLFVFNRKAQVISTKEASKFTRIKKEQEKLWTPEEKDAVGYKLGKSQYAYYQDPSTPPNIFDRRQTLLLKMQDWHVQEKYLNNFQKHN